MTEKATAVVVNWRRPRNIPRIVESLLAQPFVAEVIVWDNSGDLPHPRPQDNRVRVIPSKNVKLWGRFLAIKEAKHPWIVTQDDDYIVHNWAELWETARANPGVITGNMHLNERGGGLIPCGDGWDIMLGWGSVFRKELPERPLRRYLDRYGVDDVLRRDADRYFAVALGRRHVALQARVESLPGVSGSMALHLEPRQNRRTKEARERGALAIDVWFFKIPKTATSSIHVKLVAAGKHRQTHPQDKTRQGNVVELPSGRLVHYYDHLTPQMIVERSIATRPELESAQTFTVVRHPCDWVASIWHAWRERLPSDIRRGLLRPGDYRNSDTQVPLALPQERWLLWPDGAGTCRRVLRFERLQEDWAELASRLGIVGPLPRENKSERPHWRDCLTLQEQQVVMARERYVVETYGYTLEDDR